MEVEVQKLFTYLKPVWVVYIFMVFIYTHTNPKTLFVGKNLSYKKFENISLININVRFLKVESKSLILTQMKLRNSRKRDINLSNLYLMKKVRFQKQ